MALELSEPVAFHLEIQDALSPLTDILLCHSFAWSIKTSPNIEDTIKEMDVCALQVNQRDDWFDL